MRTLAGAILLTVALSGIVVAEDGSSLPPQDRQRQFNLKTDRPTLHRFNADQQAEDLRGLELGDNVCYTMHTLVVAREKGTDSTRIVRQQTCTPSDRFRVNHSVKPPRVVK